VHTQAVALQLASDVIRLRSQLEDAQVELGVEMLARQVQQQLKTGPGAEQQQGGEAAGCSSSEEWLQQCQASVLQTLQECRGETRWAAWPLQLLPCLPVCLASCLSWTRIIVFNIIIIMYHCTADLGIGCH
jgi:hypothetical protein